MWMTICFSNIVTVKQSNKVHIKHFLWHVAYLLFIKYICYVRLSASVLAESVIKHSANFRFRPNVACTLSDFRPSFGFGRNPKHHIRSVSRVQLDICSVSNVSKIVTNF